MEGRRYLVSCIVASDTTRGGGRCSSSGTAPGATLGGRCSRVCGRGAMGCAELEAACAAGAARGEDGGSVGEVLVGEVWSTMPSTPSRSRSARSSLSSACGRGCGEEEQRAPAPARGGWRAGWRL